jgi:hypothetical protein
MKNATYSDVKYLLELKGYDPIAVKNANGLNVQMFQIRGTLILADSNLRRFYEISYKDSYVHEKIMPGEVVLEDAHLMAVKRLLTADDQDELDEIHSILSEEEAEKSSNIAKLIQDGQVVFTHDRHQRVMDEAYDRLSQRRHSGLAFKELIVRTYDGKDTTFV